MHQTANAIAVSVKEQVQATNDISKTITEVSKNTDEVSLRLAQAKAKDAPSSGETPAE